MLSIQTSESNTSLHNIWGYSIGSTLGLQSRSICLGGESVEAVATECYVSMGFDSPIPHKPYNISYTMKELNEFLGKLDTCKVLGSTDKKTITILSPQGDKLKVSYSIKTDENGLHNDDLVFQAVMSVGSDTRRMAFFGATNSEENVAIVRWVHAKARAIEDTLYEQERAVDKVVSKWLR